MKQAILRKKQLQTKPKVVSNSSLKPNNSSEAIVGKLIRQKIFEKGLQISDVASTVGIHPAGLSRKLHGKSPITVNELTQIARVLDIDTSELLAGTYATPELAFIFSPEQEEFLLQTPLHYLLMKIINVPLTKNAVCEIFPEKKNQISRILDEMVEQKIAFIDADKNYRLPIDESQLAAVSPTPRYFEVMKEVYGEMTNITNLIRLSFPDLKKYQRHHVAFFFLTDLQVLEVRADFENISRKIKKFAIQNRLNRKNTNAPNQNFYGFTTILAPLQKSFMRRPLENNTNTSEMI